MGSDEETGPRAPQLERAAAALCACIEGPQADDFRERARAVAVALGGLYVAALQSGDLLEAAGPITDPATLPVVVPPARFGPLGSGGGLYRATWSAVYQDEYGREADVLEHSVANDVLAVHAFVARYLRAIEVGTLSRGDALRSMIVSFSAVQALIPRVLRALDELSSW